MDIMRSCCWVYIAATVVKQQVLCECMVLPTEV